MRQMQVNLQVDSNLDKRLQVWIYYWTYIHTAEHKGSWGRRITKSNSIHCKFSKKKKNKVCETWQSEGQQKGEEGWSSAALACLDAGCLVLSPWLIFFLNDWVQELLVEKPWHSTWEWVELSVDRSPSSSYCMIATACTNNSTALYSRLHSHASPHVCLSCVLHHRPALCCRHQQLPSGCNWTGLIAGSTKASVGILKCVSLFLHGVKQTKTHNSIWLIWIELKAVFLYLRYYLWCVNTHVSCVHIEKNR